MRRFGFRSLVVLCCFAVALALCATVVRDAGAQSVGVLKIGSLVPLVTKEGVEIKKWHDLFAKMVNEKGGLTVGGKKYTVEFFTYDVGYRATDGRENGSPIEVVPACWSTAGRSVDAAKVLGRQTHGARPG